MNLVTMKSDLGNYRNPFITPPLSKQDISNYRKNIPSQSPISDRYLNKVGSVPLLPNTPSKPTPALLDIRQNPVKSVATINKPENVINDFKFPYTNILTLAPIPSKDGIIVNYEKTKLEYSTPNVTNNSSLSGRFADGVNVSNASLLSGRHTQGSLLSNPPPQSGIVTSIDSEMNIDVLPSSYTSLLPILGQHNITDANYSQQDISLPITTYVSTLTAYGIHGNRFGQIPSHSNLDIDSIPPQYTNVISSFGIHGTNHPVNHSQMDIDGIPNRYEDIIGPYGLVGNPVHPNYSNQDIDNVINTSPSGRFSSYNAIFNRFGNSPIAFILPQIGNLAVNFFTNDNAKGFTLYQGTLAGREKSQFVGITGNNYSYTGTMLNVLRNPVDFSNIASLDNQLGLGSFFFKNTGFSETNRYIDGTNRLALRYTERHSPSYLDQLYAQFDLQETSYNPTYAKQPFVTRGIQNNRVREPQRWGQIMDAGMIRGGASVMATRLAFDVERIGKFLGSPKGLLFIIKQQGLQLTNPKGETVGNVPGINPTRIYNPATTLAEVGTVGLGIHLKRHGLLPEPDRFNYEAISRLNNGIINSNRLVNLKRELIDRSPGVLGKVVAGIEKLSLQTFDGSPIVFLSGITGPNSIYGAGATIHRRYVDSFKNNEGFPIQESVQNPFGGVSSFNSIQHYVTSPYNKLNKGKDFGFGLSGGSSEEQYHDFRTDLSDMRWSFIPGKRQNQRFGYTHYNLAAKFGFGEQGTANQVDRSDFTESSRPGGASSDKINLAEPDQDPTSLGQVRDLIKFKFVDPDSTDSVLIFRATITNMNDVYSAEYNTQKYVNSPENMYFYSMQSRKFSFTFTVTAMSREELLPMWRRVNRLVSLTAPKFNSSNTRMGGKWMRLTVGDYLVDKPVLLNSVTISDNNAPWDIDLEQEGRQLPMHAQITVDFSIIENTVPKYKETAFIGSDKGNTPKGNTFQSIK